MPPEGCLVESQPLDLSTARCATGARAIGLSLPSPKPACPKAQGQARATPIPRADARFEPETGCSTQIQVRPDSATMLSYSHPQPRVGRSTRGQQKRSPMESILQWDPFCSRPPKPTQCCSLLLNLPSFSRATVRQKAVLLLLNSELPCHAQRSRHTASVIGTFIFWYEVCHTYTPKSHRQEMRAWGWNSLLIFYFCK